MNWKSKIKKYALWQMVLPVLLLCLLGVVPANDTFCLLQNNTGALTNTFDTYQAAYLVAYEPNGGYWVDSNDNVSIKAGTETQYGHPTNNYQFKLLQQGGSVDITFDGTSNNAKTYKLQYKGYELGGWSLVPTQPMNLAEFAQYKISNPNTFFATTYELTSWHAKPSVSTTPQTLYAVWVENAYTLTNGVGMNNALRGNLGEKKTDATTNIEYYLPSSTTSLASTTVTSTTGRDNTLTHIIFSLGTETGQITLPTSTGTNGHTISNVKEADIRANGYLPTYVDSHQQGFIRLYRVYFDPSTYTITKSDSPTAVCVAFVFASHPVTGAAPEAMMANTSCAYMFYGLTGLIKIGGLIDNIDFANTTTMSNMYAACINLRWQDAPVVEADGSNYRINVSINLNNVENMQGMFLGCSSVKWIVFSKANMEYTVDDAGNKIYGTNTKKLNNMSHMFEGCISLVEVNFKDADGVTYQDNLDTTNVTSFNSMFLGCRNLARVDLQSLEIGPNCVSLAEMFSGCNSLTNASLTNASIDTSNVRDYGAMYSGCAALTSLDLSKIRITDQATAMSYMFAGCSKLTGITFGEVNTQNVTDFSYMFMGCSSFTTFSQTGDATGFAVLDTTNATTFEGMFMGCSKLTSANIGNWKVSKVANFSSMFANCSSLVEVDSSSWDMSGGSEAAGIDISRAFMGCSSLRTIYVSDAFQSSVSNSKIINSDMLFFGCMSLVGNLATAEDGATHKYTTYSDAMTLQANENWIHGYGLTTDSMGLFTSKNVTVPQA